MKVLKYIHYFTNGLAALLIYGGLLTAFIAWLLGYEDIGGGALFAVLITLFYISLIQLIVTIGLSIKKSTRYLFKKHLTGSAVYLLLFIAGMYFGFPYFVDEGYAYLPVFILVIFCPCLFLLFNYFKITHLNLNPYK